MTQKPTKDRIVEEALSLFAKKGFAGTTIADIAKGVQLSEGALYKHFKNKKEIFIACLLPLIEGEIDSWLPQLEDVNTLEDIIAIMVRHRFELIFHNLDAFNILFTESLHDEELGRLFQKRLMQTQKPELIAQKVRHIQTMDRPMPLPNGTFLSIGLTTMIWGLANDYKRNLKQIGINFPSKEALLDELTRFVLYGALGNPHSNSQLSKEKE
ncbi:TetR/AcrR family transcriptional regulator [Ectobacillus sp. sgz5001026]|uniref:TetR/AcrR family transcriptional regulator n=1 Tax=Ectobacillus sp. sgz5001026 TaxID=3242473 RepID=UPI0036D2C49C